MKFPTTSKRPLEVTLTDTPTDRLSGHVRRSSQHDARRRAQRHRTIGALLITSSPIMAFVGFFGAIASANACGMFGDGCAEYGQTGDGFGLMVLLFCASVPAFIGGIALSVSSVRSHR